VVRTAFAGIIAISACGLTSNQTTTLTSFGKSLSSFGQTIAAVAPSAQNAINRMRADGLSFSTASSRKEFDRASSCLAEYVHNPKASAHVALIVKLASALDAYGKALNDLASYGNSDQRLKTFADIADNVDGAFNDPITESYATAAGHGAGFVTNQVLEAIKKREVAAIVVAYQPAINAAGELFMAEFKGETEGTLFFAYRAELNAFHNRMPTVDHHEPTPPADSGVPWDGPVGLTEAAGRRQIVVAQMEYAQLKAAFDTLQKQGIASTSALLKAYAQLVTALNAKLPSVDAIEDFAKAAASLYSDFNTTK
jgi:hypothetical protein